jgi:FkbM family methyltransferase
MYAQNNLDNIVKDFFQFEDGEIGIYAEAGGSHPIDQNNTFLLEQNGWKGIIVEPKEDFNEMYKNIRPNTIVENYVLVNFEYDKETIEGDFKYYMMGGLVNTFNFSDWSPSSYKCITLQNLLEKHNFSEIHFLCLDTEGTEKDILDGIDLDKTFVHLIIVEIHEINNVKTNFDFLLEKGFDKVNSFKQHEFFVNKNSKFKWIKSSE